MLNQEVKQEISEITINLIRSLSFLADRLLFPRDDLFMLTTLEEGLKNTIELVEYKTSKIRKLLETESDLNEKQNKD